MKKLLSVLAVLFVLGTTNVFAFGIGVQGGANLGAGGGSAAVTFKLDSAPWIFAADGAFYSEYVALGVTADMWLENKSIAGPLNYFYGWGVNGSVGLGGDSAHINAGVRVLGGLNLFVLDNFLELYAQVAWQPNITILPEFGFDFIYFPVSAGIRFWF